MDDAEFVAWGAQEDRVRQAEMAQVRSAQDLEKARVAAYERRKAAGITAAQAVRAIMVSRRVARGESVRSAMTRRK